ncbi:MAG: YcjX family protein [Gammaproteobacteria bacterium]|nr:YcjX family protein [Gammaproteobacteria bacterium]
MLKRGVLRRLENLRRERITLGVTGFSRSGKTVFIGALAQALLTADAWTTKRGQGPLAQFGPFERGEYRCAEIRDDLYPELPHYPFRRVRDTLAGRDARWPEATEGVSHLVLDLEYSSQRFPKGIRHLQLELVDYPGEWLMDLSMLDISYDHWSEKMLKLTRKGRRQEWSEEYRRLLQEIPPGRAFDEELVTRLTESWAAYLTQAASAGYTLNQPGRLLRPDTLRHSPMLRLVPLPEGLRYGPLGRGMVKRFKQYKNRVIRPFYRHTFSKMDRQIVLVDLLRMLQLGEDAFNEMVAAYADTLHSFNYGKGGVLSWLTGARTSHLLFAATKADHVVRGDRANLEQMVRKILKLVDDHNHLQAGTLHHDVLALASICATEDRRTTRPPVREILYGRPDGSDGAAAYDPGGIPLDMPPDWSQLHFQFMNFQPDATLLSEPLYRGFPALNLGKALDFLIGGDFR